MKYQNPVSRDVDVDMKYHNPVTRDVDVDMKYEKKHTVRTTPISNKNIVETDAELTPLTHIDMTA